MNIPAVEAVTEHVLKSAKAYVAAIGSTASLILASQIHVSTSAHLWIEIASIVGTGIGTFVVPNKATGITIGQAVAQDGPAFQQAVEALKSVPLPGPAAQIVTQVENVEQKVATEAPLLEAAVPAAAPVVAEVAAEISPAVVQ